MQVPTFSFPIIPWTVLAWDEKAQAYTPHWTDYGFMHACAFTGIYKTNLSVGAVYANEYARGIHTTMYNVD